VHYVVLGSFVFALNGRVPLWISVLPVVPCSILAAAFLQRFVEAPFIRFARSWSYRMKIQNAPLLDGAGRLMPNEHPGIS
jgi:peptidoglycan/LPS O-acetylase OafA/YrhL